MLCGVSDFCGFEWLDDMKAVFAVKYFYKSV